MNQASSFGGYIRRRRREMDLTQEELARRVGCAAITLRKIEADDLRASVQIAERLAMALAIPLEERAEFVRWARSVRPEASDLPPVTPPPSLEEIGREDLTGRAIRGYALAERIGMGGMGSVYRAVQPNVDREVAVKIILPAFANHPDFIRRFETEAQLVARLEHPHIVPLYDYWREPGVAYLVMRLLRGGNVQSLLSQGPLTIETTTHLLEQICSALNTAHRIGVIHRDLKPANVLLDEDNNAYLADFGIAKNLGNPDLENQTQLDAIIGSPQYMSPEQIRSLSVRPQTDIYCLGVMLYEMLTGTLPFTGPTPFDFIQQHINTPMPSLSANRAGLPAALDAVIARATAKDPNVRYTDALSLFSDFQQAAGRIIAAQTINIEYEEEESNREISNPFKGLRAFSEADSENFFGRETLVQQLLARLGEGGDLGRFLAVIGPSGSGKSSVVRAGLIPALRRGGLPGSENWFIVDMLPGKHPFEELEASLLRVAVNPPESLLSQLKDGSRGLLRAVHRILPADDSVELVLVIDQFEEVFTLVEEETERALLLENLATAVLDEHSRLRVIITLRADFTDKPLRYADFGEIMNRRFEFVLPLTADEVERAVAGPAQRVGLKLEKGLISTIIREAGNQPGALPLLQYALSELFEKREGRTLSNQVYREIGGVLGALGRSAESIYANLDDVGQSTARQLFLRLVTLGEGTEDTRRRVLLAELENLTIKDSNNRLSEIIDLFGNARLLTFDHDPITRGATIEIAHEALLREWKRLGEWLYESRADVRFQRQLATAASEWGYARQDVSFLLTGARLEQFEGWAANTTVALTQDERAFLDASIAERNRRETEERDRQQREFEAAQKLAETERQSVINLRGRNRIISTVGVIALLLAILASVFGFNSNQNAQQAVNAKATAQTESLIRATAENNAIQSAAQAFSRELAVQSEFNLNVDTQRSILLALAGLDKAYTHEAENALHKAVQAERELMSIKNATSGVYSLAFSPDGKRLVSSSGASKVWDAATGKELFSFGNNLLIYSPDGTLLAGLEPVGQLVKISILDAQTGQKLLSLKDVPFADGRNMNFSPDGQLMLDVTGKIEFFDSKTGQLNSTLSGPDWTYKGLKEGDADLPFTVNAAVFSADGKRLAIDLLSDGNRNFGRVEVWDYPSRQRLLSVPVNFDVDRAFAFSPDGKYIVTAGKNGGPSVVLDAITGKELYRLSNAAYFNGFTFTPDGKYILSASEDGSVQMWEASTGGLILTLNGHQGAVFQASVSPGCVSPPTAPFEWCGLRLATSGADATIKIWDISPSGSGELLTLPGSNFFVDSDWSRLTTIVKMQPDQGGFQGIVQSWDLPVLTSPFTAKPQVSNYFSSTVDANKAALGLRIIQSAKLLIATFFDQDEFFRIWDVSSGEAKEMTTACCASVTEKADGKWILGEDVSPDRRFLFVGLNQGNIDVFDLHTGKKIHTFAVSEEGALCCETLSPDGTTLAVAATDLQIWDVATAHLSKTWPLIDTYISIMAFSPDGKSLLVGTCSGTVKVLDVATGENKFTLLSGSPSCVNSFGFSHDGRRVAIGSESGPLEIWDWNTHEEVLQLPFGNAPTNLRMQFSPDDTRLMVSAFDADAVVQNTVRVYVLPTKDIIALAKSRLTRTLTTEECQKYLHVDVCPSSP